MKHLIAGRLLTVAKACGLAPLMAGLLLMALSACSLMPQSPAVLPQTPGEIAASYSVEVRKYEKITAQLLTSQSITPEVAQQALDSLASAQASLRVYYQMSACKNVRAALEQAAQPSNAELISAAAQPSKAELISAAAQPSKAELISAAAQLMCETFDGQPLNELAQLQLAQSALGALSQQLATVK